MSTTAAPSVPAATASVSFSVADALQIMQTVAQLVTLVQPQDAAAVAVVTGAAGLVANTIFPAIQNAHDQTISIAQQASLLALSAAERLKVGAPVATVN